MVPAFPARLEALQSKTVELPGYMIPINADLNHKEFMLAVNCPWINAPYLWAGRLVPSMVEVKMVKEVGYVDKPVKIRRQTHAEQDRRFPVGRFSCFKLATGKIVFNSFINRPNPMKLRFYALAVLLAAGTLSFAQNQGGAPGSGLPRPGQRPPQQALLQPHRA